jgi:hypothetical protein
VRGSGVLPVAKVNYRIRVVLTFAGLATCAALFGKCNAAGCTHIGNSGAKKLWFNGFRFAQSEHASGLYHAEIDLAYNEDNWEKWLQVDKQELKTTRFAIFDTAGVPTGLLDNRRVWESLDLGYEDRVWITTGDFSPLDGYVT